MRRLLALLSTCGLALACLVLPAAAQSTAPPPTISITSMTPRCIDRGGEGFISGPTNRPAVRLEVFSPSRKVVAGNVTTGNQGSYANQFGFAPSEVGEHEARVTAGTTNANGAFVPTTAQASVFIQVPCRPPTLEYDPPCSTPGTTQVRMTGRLFHPLDRGSFDIDLDGDDASRLPIDSRGTFTALVTVRATSGDRRGRAHDLRDNVGEAPWPACPPGDAPTTTTSTTTAPDDPRDPVPDPTPDPDRGPEPGPTTTLRIIELPGPPVTLPPTVELPPATPGATLQIVPEVGPTGFVTGVVGTGFPPGPVVLVWEPGLGRTAALAAADGTFTARVLVLPNDRLGPRALVATGGATTAVDAFLVVPSSVQPSGRDVGQITRIRRFNQR